MNIEFEALTFDDVLLIPQYSDCLPKDVNLKSFVTREICINIPVLSSAMDTVTEARFAISLAQEGGIGVIHKNMSTEQQVMEVRKVKRFESGMVKDAITINPNLSLSDLIKLRDKYGFASFPVISDNKLIGIVTNRDFRFENDLNKKVADVMTSQEKLITVSEGYNIKEVVNLLQTHRIEKILVTNSKSEFKGLITVKDIEKAKEKPNACKDDSGRLRVAAAIGVGQDNYERIAALVDSEVDILVVDTAHGHSKGVIEMVKYIKSHYPQVQVIAGNIATASAALALADAGVDAVKVGIGPGSICTTRIVSGVGVPQISAISNIASALKGRGVPIIADGGIRNSGDIAKAIAAGAYTVMIGGLFAGTEEAPGEQELYKGRAYKSYRGMGSLGAMKQRHNSSDRYFQSDASPEKLVPEGIEGRVPYKGSMVHIVHQLMGGLRSGMGYSGCSTIDDMRNNAKFVKITAAGFKESHVHDVTITKESPNYQINID